MTPATGGGNGRVWVNSATHVYHKEGSRFYGKTKHGKYMSKQDAIKEGDHALTKSTPPDALRLGMHIPEVGRFCRFAFHIGDGSLGDRLSGPVA
jgi:hypothetical protein